MYRVNGRQRRLTLGKYPAISLADARDLARTALTKAAKGIDAAGEKQGTRLAIGRGQPQTVRQAVDEFIERHAKPNNRSWRESARIFDRYVLAAWSKRPAADIARRDIIVLLDAIVDRGSPYMANRVLAALRKFFNWCVERDILTASPVVKIPKPTKEVARERILTDAEIIAVWNVWDDMDWPFGLAMKLMLVTAQRREEVARMRWEDLDFENALWTLPREATKSDRAHDVPLSELALEILGHVPHTGEYVFTTTGNTPISGFSRAKKRCDEQSGVANWRLHDLRRTAASGMARIGIAPHVVEKVLNHASGTISGVAAVYNRHGYADEKRRALAARAKAIEDFLGTEKTDVVSIGQR